MTPLVRGILLAVLAGGIGFFLGHFATRFYTLDLKTEVGLGDVMNFTITIIFAFILQNYFQKRFGNERAQKDHLIDLIQSSISYFGDVRAIFIGCYDEKKVSKDDVKAIKALLRNLINGVGLLHESLDACGYSATSAECSEVESLYRNYKRAITGGNFPTGPYDGDTFNEAETIYGKAVSKLNRMRIDLNKK